MRCTICGRKASEGDYCDWHAKANENVVKSYDKWKTGLEISWKEYLSEIAKNPLTGEWAKQTARHLLKTREGTNVKNG